MGLDAGSSAILESDILRPAPRRRVGARMQIYRFLENGKERVGVGDGSSILTHDGRDVFDVGARTNGAPIPIDDAQILAPVTPTKIVAVGRNYSEHAKEL